MLLASCDDRGDRHNLCAAKVELYCPFNGLKLPFLAESAEFQMAKSKYSRKAEHLQQIVKQQRARLEQTTVGLYAAEKEVHLPAFFIAQTTMSTFYRFQSSSSRHHQYLPPVSMSAETKLAKQTLPL